MQSLSEDEKRAVLGEVLSDELKAILEYVKEIPAVKNDITDIKNRLSSVENIMQMHEVDIRYLRSRFA